MFHTWKFSGKRRGRIIGGDIVNIENAPYIVTKHLSQFKYFLKCCKNYIYYVTGCFGIFR